MSNPPLKKENDKPLIGILSSILVNETGLFPGMERSYVNHDYIAAVEAAGGVPLMIPVVSDPELTRRQIQAVDGILLTGGYDPNPLLFGENPSRRLDFIFPEVDDHQIAAIHAADELHRPMLGICRGLQILNVAFGGTLYQDLSLIPNSYIQHMQKSRRHTPGHPVTIADHTVLRGVFQTPTVLTNSFHHLAVKDVAPGFTVSALAGDGVIEGIERFDTTPIVAVQWHPEMMVEKHPEMLKLFRYFIDLVQGKR
jgi:putative glutamine amidotransferase